MILTDQQRWDSIGAYGNPMDLTPTLDDLASRGTLLKRAYTPQPSCGPAMACIQTGRYSTETGVWRGSQSLGEEQTLGNYFRNNGYNVGFVGSWRIAGTFDEPVPSEKRGGYNDYWIGADIPEFTTHPNEGRLYDFGNNPVEFDDYRVDAFTQFAVEAIESLDEPWFLVVSYVEPHHQNDMGTFVAPDEDTDYSKSEPYIPPDIQGRPGDWYGELPDYYSICTRIDECLNQLFSATDKESGLNSTIIAYTSDHGCHFRTRPGEYKRTCHESAVRVPVILAGPGFDQNLRIDKVTSLINLPPTLLDAVGISIPNDMHGESLLPLIHREEVDKGGEAFIQISEAEIGRAIRTNRWKYAIAAPSEKGWRGGNGAPSSEVYLEHYLYDLKKDPEESVNLVGRHDYRDIADNLSQRLRSYIRDIEDKDPEIRPFEIPGYRDY